MQANRITKALVELLLIALSLTVTSNLSAYETRNVIVDTDVALDDIRALILLLQEDDLHLIGVVTSDGSCSPEIGAKNVGTALDRLGKSEIPVAVGEDLGLPSPPWRPMSEALGWAMIEPAQDGGSSLRSSDLLRQLLNSPRDRVVYLCLGPMTNLARLIASDSAAVQRVSEVWYSGTLIDDTIGSWNTLRDTASARRVCSSGLTVRAFELPDSELIRFDSSMLDSVRDIATESARLMATIHAGENVGKLVKSGHFRAWDETVALGLIDPSLVSFRRVDPLQPLLKSDGFNTQMGRALYLNTLSQGTNSMLEPRKPTVLDHYPADESDLQQDVRPYATDIIAKYGREEWNCAILTNEFHSHLGIYSILGVKMGVRARELLHAKHGSLRVISDAGSEPPISCLNDGLQISTGASLGHGTISVREGSARVEADFEAGGRNITLKLSDEVAARIGSDIKSAIEKYGDLTPEYFAEIRRLAVQYWLDLDRAAIFEERTK